MKKFTKAMDRFHNIDGDNFGHVTQRVILDIITLRPKLVTKYLYRRINYE